MRTSTAQYNALLLKIILAYDQLRFQKISTRGNLDCSDITKTFHFAPTTREKMTEPKPFVLTAALLPDHKVLTKVNTRDAAKAIDKIIVVEEDDELYEEALTHAVSYVMLLDDGQIEVKARMVETAASVDASTRKKFTVEKNNDLYKRLEQIAGPLTKGKQVWLDVPRD